MIWKDLLKHIFSVTKYADMPKDSPTSHFIPIQLLTVAPFILKSISLVRVDPGSHNSFQDAVYLSSNCSLISISASFIHLQILLKSAIPDIFPVLEITKKE